MTELFDSDDDTVETTSISGTHGSRQTGTAPSVASAAGTSPPLSRPGPPPLPVRPPPDAISRSRPTPQSKRSSSRRDAHTEIGKIWYEQTQKRTTLTGKTDLYVFGMTVLGPTGRRVIRGGVSFP